MEEAWKDIPGYEGKYQVSNLGNVRNLKINGYLLKQSLRLGYLRTILTKNNKRKTFSSHRLVAQAFIPNPENKPQVNHINCIKIDNRVKNLEWCTNSENQIHAIKNGRVDLKKNAEHLKNIRIKYRKQIDMKKWKQVFVYNLEGVFINSYKNMTEASKITKVSMPILSNCVHGKQKNSKGFVFKLAKDLLDQKIFPQDKE